MFMVHLHKHHNQHKQETIMAIVNQHHIAALPMSSPFRGADTESTDWCALVNLKNNTYYSHGYFQMSSKMWLG